MTITEFHSYFKELAKAIPEIRHQDEKPRFTRMSVQAILGQAKSGLDMNQMCLILETPDGDLSGESMDGASILFSSAFLLLQHCPQGDLDKQTEIENAAHQTGVKLVKKMLADSGADPGEDYPMNGPYPLDGFDLSTVAFDAVGPLFDNSYGYRFEFIIYNHLNLDHNPGEWDITA